MADESDQIHIDLTTDVSEGEKARKKIEEIGDGVEEASKSFDRARDAQGRFTSGLADAERQARKTAQSYVDVSAAAARAHPGATSSTYVAANETYDLDLPHKTGGAGFDLAREEQGFRKLTDAMHAHERAAEADADAMRRRGDAAKRSINAERAGAISRAGLLGANMAQDVIQGGSPAYAINNILGAANDSGIKALAGEALAAAGGIRVVATALGTVAVAATAAFAIVDEGLESNKLGWSDLGSVIDAMAGNGFSEAARTWGETLGEFRDTLAEVVGGVAEGTVGWNSAAEAVRAHKDEVERDTAALLAYQEAAKKVAGVKSDAQEEAAKFGAKFGKDAAGMDAKGLPGLIDRLARHQAGARADRLEDVETGELDKDGKPTGKTIKTKKTGAQIAAEAITRDFAAAIDGDKDAQDGIKKRLRALGEDGSDLGRRDPDDDGLDHPREEAYRNKLEEFHEKGRREEQEEFEALGDGLDHPREEAYRNKLEEFHAAGREQAGQRAMKGTGLDKRAEDALLRSALASGGRGFDVDGVAGAISRELQAKGVDAQVADRLGREKAQEHADRLGDDAVNPATGPGKAAEAEQLRQVQRIGSADFARSVEGAGMDSQKKVAENTTTMREQLAELVRQGGKGARLG